jgi:hypothetical protein
VAVNVEEEVAVNVEEVVDAVVREAQTEETPLMLTTREMLPTKRLEEHEN